jgi:2-phospho-L-lactate transferase/gluconeogenesis factor (CofD/UPF0052 family)
MTPAARRESVPTVVFSGGRGAGALIERLLGDRRVEVSIVINGYDDGASTGEVRRFLGDALGPSDFRKNAARAARALATAADALIDLLDCRLPTPCPTDLAEHLADVIASGAGPAAATPIVALAGRLDGTDRAGVVRAITAFDDERRRTGRRFAFADCAVGNIVFAGLYLLAGRDFNGAVRAYAALLGLADGLIENVTDGTNAHLAALDAEGVLLGCEAAIVDARRRNRVRSIFLLDREPPPDLAGRPRAAIDEWLAAHAATPQLNPRVLERVRHAALIVFAPGTQHSSLFPSYLTDGLGEAIAANQQALKLLVTNLQPDADTPDANGVDIVERALHYLRRRSQVALPAPTLITHALINEPRDDPAAPAYVPTGAVGQLADPRRAWVHDFEAGATGRHDGPKVLDPFLDDLLAALDRPRVAVLLDGTDAADSVLESALELVRGGVTSLNVDVRVFHGARTPIDGGTAAALPFPLVALAGDVPRAFVAAADAWPADYVATFDSSGMYWGEDLVHLLAQLTIGRPAAVWGSRRLSVRDVHASYRLRYRRHRWLGAASYVGSHALSLLYLVLYGRYVSDTLSPVRVVAQRYVRQGARPPGHAQHGHVLLSAVLRDQAELRELPVRFLSLPSARARRTRLLDGLIAIGLILWLRLRRPGRGHRAPDRAPALAGPAA